MDTLNNKFYLNSYKKNGINAKGVHWESKESQYIRFQIITTLVKDIEKVSIVDVGCGFGEYLTYLEEQNLLPDLYLGIDSEKFMIDIASKRYEKHLFLKCDILKQEIPKADYLICSGAFNLFTRRSFFKAIRDCFEASKKGFIFNFLTKNSIHCLKEEEILVFCKELSTKVTIKNNYLSNDSTILMEKQIS